MHFRSVHGRYEYAPFRTYQLPELCTVRDEAKFAGRGKVQFRRTQYRLRWPGEGVTHATDRVPGGALRIWGIDPEAFEEGEPGYALHDYRDRLPEELPTEVAYHLAVNRDFFCFPNRERGRGKTLRAVGGLPPERVDEVLDARFALTGKAYSTLLFLKHEAECLREHPLLQDFDTAVRERLFEAQEAFVRSYFILLADHIYDPETQYWGRGETELWWRMATYLHWLRRTGDALPAGKARLEAPFHWDVTPEDVEERLGLFQKNNYNRYWEN